MKTAEIFKFECNNTALSNVFIRISDKRTPCGNYFFRLDKLDCISVIDNSGLTPLLEITGDKIDPSVTYEKFMDFLVEVFQDVSKNTNSIKVYELVVDEETVRNIPSHPQEISPEIKNKNATHHRQCLYSNGAHTGEVCYTINVWGMNSPAREAAIKEHLDEFISGLNVSLPGLQVDKI